MIGTFKSTEDLFRLQPVEWLPKKFTNAIFIKSHVGMYLYFAEFIYGNVLLLMCVEMYNVIVHVMVRNLPFKHIREV